MQSNFCKPIVDVPRIKDRNVGGGGLMDIGIYVVQFAVLVFKEMPQSITAVGNLRGGV